VIAQTITVKEISLKVLEHQSELVTAMSDGRSLAELL
jgi:hypothetical protein